MTTRKRSPVAAVVTSSTQVRARLVMSAALWWPASIRFTESQFMSKWKFSLTFLLSLASYRAMLANTYNPSHLVNTSS